MYLLPPNLSLSPSLSLSLSLNSCLAPNSLSKPLLSLSLSLSLKKSSQDLSSPSAMGCWRSCPSSVLNSEPEDLAQESAAPEPPKPQLEDFARELVAPLSEWETPKRESEDQILELEALFPEAEATAPGLEDPMLELKSPRQELEVPTQELKATTLDLKVLIAESKDPTLEMKSVPQEQEIPASDSISMTLGSKVLIAESEGLTLEVKSPPQEVEVPKTESEEMPELMPQWKYVMPETRAAMPELNFLPETPEALPLTSESNALIPESEAPMSVSEELVPAMPELEDPVPELEDSEPESEDLELQLGNLSPMEARAVKILKRKYTHLAVLTAVPENPVFRSMCDFLAHSRPTELSVRLAEILRGSPVVHTRVRAVSLLCPLIPSFQSDVKSILLSCLAAETSGTVLSPLASLIVDVHDRLPPWSELLCFLCVTPWDETTANRRFKLNALTVLSQWRCIETLAPYWEASGLSNGIISCLKGATRGCVRVALFAALQLRRLFALSPGMDLKSFSRAVAGPMRGVFFRDKTKSLERRMRTMCDFLSKSTLQWESLTVLLSVFMSVRIKDVQESALLFFAHFQEFAIPEDTLHLLSENLSLWIFESLKSSNLNVKVAAFGAGVRLILMEKLFPLGTEVELLDSMLSVLSEMVAIKEEVHAQRALTEMVVWALESPETMRPRLEKVVQQMALFASNGRLLAETRIISIQIVVDIAQKAPEMMKKLNPKTLRMVIVALMVMLSDPSKKNLLDSADTSLEEIAASLQGCKVLAVVMEQVMLYVNSTEWNRRNAGLIALCSVVKGCPKAVNTYLNDVCETVSKLIEDSNLRVRQAANCLVEELSEELSPQFQDQYHRNIMPALLLTINDNENRNLQIYGVTALASFSKGCSPDVIKLYLERTMCKLVQILQNSNENDELRDGVLTAVASVTSSSKEYFREYYGTVMRCVRSIFSATFTKDNLIVFAKSIKCIASAAATVGKETADFEQVLKLLMQLQMTPMEGDDPVRSFLMQGWVELYESLELKLLKDLMPYVLLSAETEIAESATDSSVTDFLSKEKAAACSMLSLCALGMKESFYPWICKAVDILVPLLEFYLDEVRAAAISAMPELLDSAIHANEKGQLEGCDMSPVQMLVADAIKFLVQALTQELDKDISARIISTINRCIEIYGMHLNDMQVEYIISGAKLILGNISHKNREMARLLKEENVDKVEHDLIKRNKEQDSEIVKQIGDGLGKVVGKIKTIFLPFLDELLPHARVLLHNAQSDKEKQAVYHLFLGVLQHYRGPSLKKFLKHLPSLSMLKDESPNTMQEAAYEISILAECTGSDFKPYAEEVLHHLCAILKHPYAEGSDDATAFDIAVPALVSAVGKICDYHSETINSEMVLPTLLSHLPIKTDMNVAKLMHERLCSMLEKKGLLCINNLPKIIAILAEVLSQPGNLATMETCDRMTDIYRKIKLQFSPSDLEDIIVSLPSRQQELLNSIV